MKLLNFLKEASVLIYTLCHFGTSAVLGIVINYFDLPASPTVDFAVFMAFILQHLLVFPVLCLILNA
ncbi:hypothetical protein L596_026883 [Steinernema carpocapsae]|uniref:Uncharacterized protein n=1 Tax=Steinernema carpocapsae TaxID=34508 RepID=A0A4U5M3L9_STECR|nr:hypothetical protein L596_026883 [Steinernema carpocapsae]